MPVIIVEIYHISNMVVTRCLHIMIYSVKYTTRKDSVLSICHFVVIC